MNLLDKYPEIGMYSSIVELYESGLPFLSQLTEQQQQALYDYFEEGERAEQSFESVGTDIEIRDVAEEDMNAVYHLRQALDYNGEFEDMNIVHEGITTRVAALPSGEVAGFYSWEQGIPETIEIERHTGLESLLPLPYRRELVVNPDYQGKGIARALAVDFHESAGKIFFLRIHKTNSRNLDNIMKNYDIIDEAMAGEYREMLVSLR